MNTNILWKQIKRIRAKYITKLPDKKTCKTTILKKNFVEILMSDIKKTMKKNDINSTEIVANISKKTGAEMFILLNMCPSFYVRLFRKVIFKGKIKNDMVLSSTNENNVKLQSKILMISAKIVDKANDDFKVKAAQILSKITSVLGINHISSYQKENDTSELKINFENDMLLIKGWLILIYCCRWLE